VLGKFCYGSGGAEFDFEDRLLAHLQAVISAKLRRGESCMFSWTQKATSGGGRCVLWLDPNFPLHFWYATKNSGPVNRAWLAELMQSANSVGGLCALPEPPKFILPGVVTPLPHYAQHEIVPQPTSRHASRTSVTA